MIHLDACIYCGKYIPDSMKPQPVCRKCSEQIRAQKAKEPKPLNECKWCGSEYLPKSNHQIYCGAACKRENARRHKSVWRAVVNDKPIKTTRCESGISELCTGLFYKTKKHQTDCPHCIEVLLNG